jgi:ABC-type multidrug transport system fused ATPase/permease subunit
MIVFRGKKKEKLIGEIEFKNVDFHYPTRPDVPVLKNLALKIHPGQTVAFVWYFLPFPSLPPLY